MEGISMGSLIKQLETVAKLPSYLFVLNAITEINEKIFLYCPSEERVFISAMLNLIGLQTCSQRFQITNEIKSLFILNTFNELSDIACEKNNYYCNIIYIVNGISDEIEKQKIEQVLSKYPHFIIVTDVESTVRNKYFLINMHRNNPYYKKLEKYILQYGTTY